MFDELNCVVVEFVEVVRTMGDFPGFISHEFDVLFDVFDVLDVFFGGVGIVKPQVALAFVGFGHHKVETHGFAVTDVQIPVGLRRESSQDNVSELVISFLNEFLRVNCRFHFPANQLSNVLYLHDLLLCLLFWLVFFLPLFFLFGLILLVDDLVGEPFGFPCLFKEIFE